MMTFLKKYTPIIFRKIPVFFLGFFLSLLLLESGIRLGGIFFQSVQDYGNWRSVSQKGSYRILCIGESTTEHQYPKPLERILNERNIGIRFSVIDKGRTLANTQTLLSRVDAQLAEYRPNMVIAMMGINDGNVKYYQEISTVRTWVFKHCRSYQLFKILWMNFSKTISTEDPFRSNHRVISEQNDIKDLDEATSETASSTLDRANDYILSGKRLAKEGDLALAAKTFRQALKVDKFNDRACSELGWINLRQGEPELAERYFELALKLNSNNENAYAGLGRTYFSFGEFDAAEDFLKKALALNPQNEDALSGVGLVCLARGETSQAESFFREALELNPESYRTRLSLASIYRRRGEFSQARDLLEKATGLSPARNKHRIRALASIEEESGKVKLGLPHTVKAAAWDRDYPDMTINNYRKLKGILGSNVRLVCVQYPMRPVEQLEKIFRANEDVIFVNNDGLFREVVKKEGYAAYFRDMFGGDFGHCTPKGNELLAQNIADVILKEVFKK